jgi:hypothetical protein
MNYLKLKEMFKEKILYKYHVEIIMELLLIAWVICILGEVEKQLNLIKDNVAMETLIF